MARAIWTGSVAFGLVNVPVKLYAATEARDIRFHQFQKDTGKRVHNRRVAEGTDDEVAYDDIVKGYEAHKGEFVIVTPEELEGVAPGASRTIDIEDFVELADVDPVFFERSYYLGPADKGAAPTYRLLLDAMADTGKAAIGRFVMRTKEYLAAIRPGDGVLVLETLYFADEIRDRADVVGDVPKAKVGEREVRIARQLVDSMATEWDPSRYRDTYRERVLDLLERKAEGEEIVLEEPQPRARVLDLMSALEQSLESARQGGRASASTGSSGARSGRGRTARSASKGTRTTGSGSATRNAKAAGQKRSGAASTGKRSRTRDYSSWPKRRLDDEARRLDIPGRSKMDREELVEALQRAS
ncbi:MAG TPA: Ku protein [Acidimicrobiia bacterium]|jgi:DNA end-binding protein Ku